MRSQSYLRLESEADCDIREDTRPLVVNCVGQYITDGAFTTNKPTGRQDIYLMYLSRGSLTLYVGDQRHELPAGGMFLFAPEIPYRYGKEAGDELCYYWAHFTGSRALEMVESYGLSLGQVYLPEGQEEAATDFRMLFRSFYGKGPLFEAEAAGTLAALLARLARRSTQRQGGPGPWRVRDSLDYLYRHYAQPIRLEELAALEHLSPSRYSALFRTCMGVSPQGFLIGLRIQNAADLLRRTDLSIVQVALAVGYEDPLYFSSLFHRKMGMPPSQYRVKFSMANGEE